MKLSIVIPTYNERKNLKELVDRVESTLKEIEYELIIVDDDSPDKTWKLAEKISNQRENVKSIRRTKEKGLATAVVRGFKESKGNILGVMDSDLQHPPEKLSELLREIKKSNDIVIGSRHTGGGRVENWPFFRKLVSKVAELICRILLRKVKNIKDPLSGFFMVKKEVLEGLELNPEGYKILLEVLAKGEYDKVKEVPYIFKDREEGSSSCGMKEYFNYLKHVFKLVREVA